MTTRTPLIHILAERYPRARVYLLDPGFPFRLMRYAALVILYFPRFLFLRIWKQPVLAFDCRFRHYDAFYEPIYAAWKERAENRISVVFLFRFESNTGRSLPLWSRGLPVVYAGYLDRKVLIAADSFSHKALPRTRRVQIFHGFGSFGTAWSVDKFLKPYDVFFMPNRYLYEEFQSGALNPQPGQQAYPVGYPKLDPLIRVARNACRTTTPTLFYGPTYGETVSSIVEFLPRIVELCRERAYRLILKLHPYLYNKHIKRHCGGVDWVKQIREYQKTYDGIILIDRDASTEALGRKFAETNLFLTDVSGLGYEFVLATGKPILFLGTRLKVPRPDMPGLDQYPEIYYRGIIGPIVQSPGGLGEAVALLLRNNSYREAIASFRREYVPNLGCASQRAAELIREMLSAL